MRVLEGKLASYLLGELAEQERIEIEDSYMADGDFFDLLRVAEDELIDDYVRGRLQARERSLFEKNFLCVPAHRQRVELARALMTFVDQKAAREPVRKTSFWQRFKKTAGFDSPGLRLILVTGFMLALLFGSLATWRFSRLNSEMDSLRAEQRAQQAREQELRGELAQQKTERETQNENLTREARERWRLEQEVEKLKEKQSPPPSVVVALGSVNKPGLPEGLQTIEISKNTEIVRLQMPLFDDAYQSYLVSVKDEKGKEVWQGGVSSSKNSTGHIVSLRLPARYLNAGKYRLTLSGTNDKEKFEVMTSYEIQVIRK